MEQRELASIGVLGILAEEDRASVETVHERLQHTFGRYWGASTGILVPTIDHLEEQGHVELTASTPVATYKLTDSGQDRLQSLLTGPVEDVSHPSFRPHLMLKLGFLHHLPTERQRDELNQIKDQLHTARETLLDIDETHETAVENRESVGYRRNLTDLRVRITDAFLAWLDEVEPTR
ncbi:hypothetical protein C482_03451 [Natrialba chahannaoensis JCM 10990]|uniref:Transcription regulator PadR C-terminal domain-containing protein n=1 Tax=Natrialba chahannaoensis JCM 10990 TaxID=1227492 RepID=M0AZJ1_9EURY|nr:helix-turn-helix transcriptional regulator [Natrialba chahannaoensis]ELZ04056.1 hypothetical protein C482_03451 [Natrialba chahannaoensis JCM 10990]